MRFPQASVRRPRMARAERAKPFERLLAPGIYLLAAAALRLSAPALARYTGATEPDPALERASTVALWLAATFLAVRVIEHALAHRFARRSGRRPPDLLRLLVMV